MLSDTMKDSVLKSHCWGANVFQVYYNLYAHKKDFGKASRFFLV